MASAVTVDHPVRPATPADCRFRVELAAPPTVHRANGGILDRALEVVLVRRDAPGTLYLAKDDPRAILLPDSEMPPESPPLPPGCEAMDPGSFGATLDLGLLDGGLAHDGSARYYVFAAFAESWCDPRPLDVEHPRGPLPAALPPPLPPLDPNTTEVRPALLRRPGVRARYYATGGVPRIAGAFHLTRPGGAAVTLVAQRLRPTGGVVTAAFAVDARPAHGAHHGGFVVPLASFLAGLAGERVRVITFVGDEVAAPLDFKVPDALA